jgi:hypothetical protein
MSTGDVAKRRIFETLEDGVAVEIRHHDVEQHEVHGPHASVASARPGRRPREHLSPGARGRASMARLSSLSSTTRMAPAFLAKLRAAQPSLAHRLAGSLAGGTPPC